LLQEYPICVNFIIKTNFEIVITPFAKCHIISVNSLYKCPYNFYWLNCICKDSEKINDSAKVGLTKHQYDIIFG
jgi:hypothetical protein